MPTYSDRRARYRHAMPQDFSSVPRFDNPQTYTAKREPATRNSTPPRDAFRIASAPKPPEPPAPEPIPTGEPVPDASEWEI